MGVSFEPFVKLLAGQLRAAGVPVDRLEVDRTYEWRHEPDERVVLRSWSVFRESAREETFTAPLFRWSFTDGRRFQGRPKVHIRKGEWSGVLSGSETAELDGHQMAKDLAQMIRLSLSPDFTPSDT